MLVSCFLFFVLWFLRFLYHFKLSGRVCRWLKSEIFSDNICHIIATKFDVNPGGVWASFKAQETPVSDEIEIPDSKKSDNNDSAHIYGMHSEQMHNFYTNLHTQKNHNFVIYLILHLLIFTQKVIETVKNIWKKKMIIPTEIALGQIFGTKIIYQHTVTVLKSKVMIKLTAIKKRNQY
jgi:hypothetical protein